MTITAPQSYASGVTYPITVTVFDSAQRCWGFELSVRTQAGKQAGTLTVGSDGFTQLLPPANGTQYISHTLVGTRNGTTDKGSGVSFNFTWTARGCLRVRSGVQRRRQCRQWRWHAILRSHLFHIGG